MNSDNYNYESPITRIQNQLLEEMVKKEEDQFMCEVRKKIGYQIDKAELIKALNYDREQYDKGYYDGCRDGETRGYQRAENEKRKGYWFDVGSLSCRCSVCGCKNNKESNYCPECGAYMKGETMTKQQVIDILEAYKPSGNVYNGYNSIEEKVDEKICDLIDEIIESVKQKPDNEWIKCGEKMPENGKSVLVVIKEDGHTDICVGETNKSGNWMISGEHWYEKSDPAITHWMPLPERPKIE